jgi:ANTAR domain/GAF domain
MTAVGAALAGGVIDEMLSAALCLVVAVAGASVELADGASVSLVVGDHLETAAASNDLIQAMDADQYALGEGPCVSATMTGVLFRSNSVVTETRWPKFVRRAAERGIGSIISTPLSIEGRSVGALNICSRTAWAFTMLDSPATVLATQASAMLRAHEHGRRTAEVGTTLEGALTSRRPVTLAQGVLMERGSISADEAYWVLRRLARSSGFGLEQQATRVLDSIAYGSSNETESG